jgi:hypothetical protein
MPSISDIPKRIHNNSNLTLQNCWRDFYIEGHMKVKKVTLVK